MRSDDMFDQASYWPNYCKPSATASVVAITGSPCSYRFTLTVTRGHCDLTGTFNFRLADGFSNITNITPSTADVTFDSTTDTGVWDFGTLSAQSATVSFTLQYTGPAGRTIFQSASVTYNCGYGGSRTVNARITNLQTTTQCPVTPPVDVVECCEACANTSFNEVTFDTCDDDVMEISMPAAAVTVAPSGKRLSVHLDLPRVCSTKDVNVGVFVTEVMNAGTANETEVDYAHKVIRRTANDTVAPGTCTDDRDCDCVDFFIDDATACSAATPRTFRVRTQAHYVEPSTTATATQQCSCNACPDD